MNKYATSKYQGVRKGGICRAVISKEPAGLDRSKSKPRKKSRVQKEKHQCFVKRRHPSKSPQFTTVTRARRSRSRSHTGKKSKQRQPKISKSPSGHSQMERRGGAVETQPTSGYHWQQSEMSSIHNLARKASIKKLSKQRSDVTGYFPLRRQSQDGPEYVEDALSKQINNPPFYMQGSQTTPASGARRSSSPSNGIEHLTRLKRSVLNGPQPNLLTNELRKYLSYKASPGPEHNSKSKSRKSRSRSKSKSPCKYAIVNGQKTRITYNPDLPKTPTTAMHSSLMNCSHSKGMQHPRKQSRKKSASKSSKKYKVNVPHFKNQSEHSLGRIHYPHRSASRFKCRTRQVARYPYHPSFSGNPGKSREHSRSYSKVSFRSDNGCHTSNRCLSINLPNRADYMGRRGSAVATANGQLGVHVAVTGGPRVEQVMVSPQRYSLEQEKFRAAKRQTYSSVKARKRRSPSKRSKSLKRSLTTPAGKKGTSHKRKRHGRAVKAVSVGAGSAPPRRRRQTRALSTTFGARHLKSVLLGQEEGVGRAVSMTGSVVKKKKPAMELKARSKSKRKSKSKSVKKAKSHGPVSQWMQLMTCGSLKKSSRTLKLKKLEKANRKRRARSLKQRSQSMKKRRNEKLLEARKNIKARMQEQQQALERFEIEQSKAMLQQQQMLQQQHASVDGLSPQPYQNLTAADVMAASASKLPNGATQSAADGQVPVGFYSSDTNYDYRPARLLDTNGATPQLGSSLRLDNQPYAFAQPLPGPGRLRTESSQRTLSVENYQINEERASRGNARQSGQTGRGQSSSFMKTADTGKGDRGKRHASRSQGSSIRYSETLDNEIIAQQMNGQLITMPVQYFGNQESIPSDVMMQGHGQRTPKQKSEASLERKCSRSLSKSKRQRDAAQHSRSSVTVRGSRSRNAVSRTQSKRSTRNEHSTTRKKSRKHSRNSLSRKSRSQSHRSRKRSPKKSLSNGRVKSKQGSTRQIPMKMQSPESSTAIHLQQHSGYYDPCLSRSTQPPLRSTDYARTQSRLSVAPAHNFPPDGASNHYASQMACDKTFLAHSCEVNQDDFGTYNHLQSQAALNSLKSHQEGRLPRRCLETMQTSQHDLQNSMMMSHHRNQHSKLFVNQTEQRERRLRMQGVREERPLLEGKAAREELRELNFRQENRLAALKESLKQNLEEIKQTKKQLREGNKADDQESNQQDSTIGRRKEPKTFVEKVHKYSDRIDAMIQERYEREVTKIQDRRLKLQILKNRAEREAKEQQSEGRDLATLAESRHESGDDTIATERERQVDIDELIRFKQEEIEGLQRQKLLKRLSQQVENKLQNFDAGRLERMSVACSAVDLRKQSSDHVEAADSLMTTGARPRLTQSYVQFSAGNAKSSARRSNGSARKSARKSARRTERNSETKSARRSISAALHRKGKHESRKRTQASRAGSMDSGKVSTKSIKRKRSHRKKSSRGSRKRSPSKTAQLTHDDIIYMEQNTKRRRSNHSKNPSRNLQPYKTEVMNSKNSTIVHQCKASAGSERPTPELGTNDPYDEINPYEAQRDVRHHSGQQAQLPGIVQDQAKKLRFSMDRGGEAASANNGAELMSARGSAFASARSGMPFNIQTAQGMTGSGPGYGPSGPGLIYNNLIRINKDSGIFENFGSCSITVDNAPNGSKEGTSKPKCQHNSILKNSSAKLGNSQASLERSCSHEDINSHIGSSRSQRPKVAPTASLTEYGGVSMHNQCSTMPREHLARGKGSSRPVQPTKRNSRAQNKVSQSSYDDSEDSDSDIEFQYGNRAAFIDKVRRVVAGRRGSKDRHLPKWQRLAVNQIRV